MTIKPATYARAVQKTFGRRSLRQVARLPLEREAAALIASEPAIDLADVAGGVSFTARVSAPDSRHDWSLHSPDQLVLQAIIAGRGVRTAFEIGTFNGGTTRTIAEALPDDGKIWTLDLPPADFDQTQQPDAFTGSQVGRVYRGSPAEGKITQLLGDSTAYDFTPYAGTIDLVLVDGGHAYEHGIADTKSAFALVAPRGVILWDDFEPYWHGLVRGIFDAAGTERPHRLAGTSMGVWFAGSRAGRA